MSDEEVRRKREILDTHRKRLHERELQAAAHGVGADPAIKIEIEEIRSHVTDLEQEIQKLLQIRATVTENTSVEQTQGQVQASVSRRRSTAPVPVILAGCGWWARNRTVLPLRAQNPELFDILGVTALKDERREFEDLVAPEMERRKIKRPLYYRNLSQAIRACRQLVGNDRMIAVIINTPNRLHEELAHQALENKCHVYAERPINRTSEELTDLISVAYQENRLLYNGVQRRLEAPYKYFFDVVEHRKNFGQLASIRCTLASGRQIEGWRSDRSLAGGGVVIDEGYHLLDIAAWLSQAAHPETAFSADNIRVSASFEYDKMQRDLEVEIAAGGTAILPNDVMLYFDLSYNVPLHSVYELVEIRDTQGNRVRYVRDLVERNVTAGRVIHQLRDSTVIGDGYIEIESEGVFSFISDNPVTGANNTGPLRQFLQQVSRFDDSMAVEKLSERISGVNDCDARFVLNTQELVTAIYREDPMKFH
jgi:predicted dehydrogenase